MSESSIIEIALAFLGVLVVIIGYLLSHKDTKQQAEIADLYKKHDADATRLQDLEIKLAANHPERNELNDRFNKLEATFAEGFRTMNSRLDRLFDQFANSNNGK